MFTEARRPSGELVEEVAIASLFSTSQELKGKTNGSDATDLYDKHDEPEIRKDETVFRVILYGGKKSFLLLLLLINTATSKALIALVAPFFPGEAERRYGADSTMVGVIIAVYPLAMMLSAPLWSYLTPYAGRMYIYCAGVLTLALATALFSLAPTAAVCIVLRVIQGIGNSATTTVTLAMASALFPANIGVVTGLLEVALGVGFFAGPPLGSLLYTAGGYSTPFFTFAGILAGLAGLFWAAAFSERGTLNSADQRSAENATVAYSRVISLPLLLAAGTITLTAFAYSFYDPVLAPELEHQLGVTESQLGLIFALPSLPYALTSPFAGWLADRAGCKPVMVAGLFIMGVSFALMGPAPFLVSLVPAFETDPAQWAFKVTTLLVYGAGAALALIPAYPDMHKGVSHLGPAAVDRVSGLFTMAYATGEVSGPILGGLLYDVIGFGWESFAVGMVILSYGALVLSLLLLRVVPKSGRFVSDVQTGHEDSVSGLSHSGSVGNDKCSESLA